MRPAGSLERRPRRLGAIGLAVDRVVAPFAEAEGKLFTVGRMLKVAAEVADTRVRRLVDSDQHHLARNPLAANLKVEHRRHGHRGRHPRDLITARPPDLLHVPVGILKTGERVALKREVREDAVNPGLHLVGEAGHHGVDDDHRRHAESHADDARQRDPPGAKIAPAKQELVHAGRSLTGAGKGGGRGKVAAAGSRKKPKNARFPWLPKVPARSQERPEPCHPEGRRLVWFAGRESLRRWDISHYRLRRSCPQTSEISRLLRLPRPAS